MKRYLFSTWPSLLSMIAGALIATIGSVWASGQRIGKQEAQIEDIRNVCIPRIEHRQEILEKRILDGLDKYNDAILRIEVSLGELRTQQRYQTK